MPGTPHFYPLKKTWRPEEPFIEAPRKMRAVEHIEEFFEGWWYRRFTANGYKYWTMGANRNRQPGKPCNLILSGNGGDGGSEEARSGGGGCLC